MKEWHDDPAASRGPRAGEETALGKRTLVDTANGRPTHGVSPARRADGKDAVLQAKHSPDDGTGVEAESPKPSHPLSELARTTIEELDSDKRKRVLLATVVAAANRGELPAFTAILKSSANGTYGDHFIFLINELQDDYGSQTTVALLQQFADAGVDVTAKLDTYDLQPLAAVAKFKSLAGRFRVLIQSGDLSEADQRHVTTLIADAVAAVRSIEGPPKPRGPKGVPQVEEAGGVAIAAGVAWRVAGALAADDVTGIGVADDVAIPFVIVAAATLSAIALARSHPKPVTLDYGTAKAPLQAALRQMTDLLAVSSAMAIQGDRAAGQVRNIAQHLARLLVLASVGGMPSGEPPKKNDDNDNHWWKEIKASLKAFSQATKGASRKQIMRELLKGFNEAQIAEIEATLARAEQMMGENVGRILPPP